MNSVVYCVLFSMKSVISRKAKRFTLRLNDIFSISDICCIEWSASAFRDMTIRRKKKKAFRDMSTAAY